LAGVSVVADRAENAGQDPRYRERFDIALARAVAPLPALAELTLPFVRVGGQAVLQKSGDVAAELATAETAVRILGGTARIVPIDLAALPGRSLVVIDKIGPTPAPYPRRAGMPAKRPIA
jgi:16S rRNA (guanine527-N7)-methyltransferase